MDKVVPVPESGCAICGTPLLAGRDPRRIYCSRACNEAARGQRYRNARQHRFAACAQCENVIAEKRVDARFCSEKCGSDFHNDEMAAKRRATRKPCANCEQPIPLGRQRFCSDECKRAARRHETYGLSHEGLALLLAQHAVCAICQTDQWGRKGPQIDHDHATGAVRGVLCIRCNTMLGHANDDPARLRAAVAYLETRQP